MSHTTRLEDDKGHTWILIHNGDWSGDVDIKRFDVDPDEHPTAKPVEEYTLPGAVIRQACASAVILDTISLLEQWDGTSDAADAAQDAMRKERRKSGKAGKAGK